MLEIKKITKIYETGDFKQKALDSVSLSFRENEFAAILGHSGSGKTTFLNIIGGLDHYTSGDLIINEVSTKKFKDVNWDSYRNHRIGFVFQNYNLITHQSVLANVRLALTLSGVSKKEANKRAKKALADVGLTEHINKKPNQLSGGQMQRVAIARALVNNPDILLADEPTGALDSETSIQIMELLKKIAKDKLVIMVTHNPELASKYANRIITLQDGKVTSDTNPYDGKVNTKEETSVNKKKNKKTSMSFFTALALSFNNIRTKKGRTLITAFASSIGIIGIALILSLSNGFQLQIDKFEKDTLSQMPIVISQEAAVVNKETQDELMKTFKVDENSYTNKKEIYPTADETTIVHYNKLDLDYMDYLESVDESLVGGVSYQRMLNMNILHKNVLNNKVELYSSRFFPIPETIDGQKSIIMDEHFELIYGREAENYNELLLLIDVNNGLESAVFKALGFDTKKPISFDDIINQEFKIVLNDDYYTSYGNSFMPALEYDGLYNNKNNITLKITGIIRGKQGSKFAQYSGNGICYKEALIDKLVDLNKNSKIVKAQEKNEYNVLTGEKFDLNTSQGIIAKNNVLAIIGAKTAPYVIQLYPKDFDSKDKIIEHLEKFNKDKSDEDKIIFTDMAEAISSLTGNIMNDITIVLIAFSSISLIVSSIMIGIITYISVLERTKEIGILRAVGARKKDIKRVFNAETFIIGLASAILGLLIAGILTIPINKIIYNLTDLDNVAKINYIHAGILVLINITLTMIGGFIPAKMASKKDPVEALRSE